jgi:hypothetical protein
MTKPEPPSSAEIEAWLHLLFRPGDVIEFRALGVVDNSKYPAFTVSGYYDFDHLSDMAKVCLHWTRLAEGCYFTLNPVLPDLLARAANRVVKRPKHTTTDAEILHRRHLVFDADPVRPAGVSATKEEKDLARSRIQNLVGHLTELGWPQPIPADSGNGFHALYAIDLPRDDGGLVERVLKSADHGFSDGHVHIDPKLFNPARIIKLYGSIARKGDHTPTRPHRYSQVLKVPQDLLVVPVDLLEAFAEEPARKNATVIQVPKGEPIAESAEISGAPHRSALPGGTEAEKRARAYVFAPEFPESIEGQDGHGRLYHVACILVDGFGLGREQARPIFEEWNRLKARPPETDKQVAHKLDDAMKNHPVPSCSLLNARRSTKEPHPDRVPSEYPSLAPGRWVMATDRDPANYGQIVDDCGDSARVHFVSPAGYEADALISKSQLRNMDGTELSETASRDWLPLRYADPPQPLPFPVEVFPVALQKYCQQVAESTRAPVDFVGTVMLVAAGAAIGQSVNLRVKRTWLQAPLLYGILVAPPGKMKSPVISRVVAPLRDIDHRLRTESEEARKQWEEDKKADKDPDGPPADPEPPRLRLVVKDITREALAVLLADNPRGLLCDPDEASGWVAAFNEYKAKGGADRQFWLSNWSSEPISVDRKGGRESINVPSPLVAVLGGLQPDMLTCLSDRKNRNDGFLDRILFSYPGTFPRQRWSETEVSEEVESDWADVIEVLHAQTMTMRAEDNKLSPHQVTFTEHAKEGWVEWYDAHADEMEDPGLAERQAGQWSKMRNHAARFALILSRLRIACDPVPPEDPSACGDPTCLPPVDVVDVRGAIELVNYFKSHLLRVSHQMTSGIGSGNAKAVIDWIKRNEVYAFRESEVRAHLRRFRDQPQALAAALKALSALGVVRTKPETQDPHKRGPRPSPAYEVHPDLVEAPDNSGNSPIGAEPESLEAPDNSANSAISPSQPPTGAIGGIGGIDGRDQESQDSPPPDREVFEV